MFTSSRNGPAQTTGLERGLYPLAVLLGPRPDSTDSLQPLWARRLLDEGLAKRIAAALNSGSKSPPLSESELAPLSG